MSKSDDLISREAILKKTFTAPGYFSALVSSWDIANAPAVDAVTVVRCKDCQYLYFKDMLAYCTHMVNTCTPYGFCSYGEQNNNRRTTYER